MGLQRATIPAAAKPLVMIVATAILSGCAGSTAPRTDAPYHLVATGALESSVRVYQSQHYTLYTTLSDVTRVGPIMDTLEVAYGTYVDASAVRPADSAPRMNVYVFQRRAEWESFTRSRAGAAAPIYLRLHRGGYTIGDSCAVVDQGDRDTRMVLAHEGFHLFVSSRFVARPPPFLEEGLASTFESILDAEGRADASCVDRSGVDSARRVAVDGAIQPLRALLGMHAGNVIGHEPGDVANFYAQAVTFVRFLRTGEQGRYRPAFDKLLADAATGRLSSADLTDTAAMVERYLGTPLNTIEPQYRAFARAQAGSELASDR